MVQNCDYFCHNRTYEWQYTYSHTRIKDVYKRQLIFIAPGQVFGAEDDGMQFQPDGYLLMFHPDPVSYTHLHTLPTCYTALYIRFRAIRRQPCGFRLPASTRVDVYKRQA